MDLALVDGSDGGVGIGVGRQQRAFGCREQIHRLTEEGHAVDVRHALVGQEQRYRIVALLELVERLQCGLAAVGSQDPVPFAVALAQIARHRPQHLGIVVHREDYRFSHLNSLLLH